MTNQERGEAFFKAVRAVIDELVPAGESKKITNSEVLKVLHKKGMLPEVPYASGIMYAMYGAIKYLHDTKEYVIDERVLMSRCFNITTWNITRCTE